MAEGLSVSALPRFRDTGLGESGPSGFGSAASRGSEEQMARGRGGSSLPWTCRPAGRLLWDIPCDPSFRTPGTRSPLCGSAEMRSVMREPAAVCSRRPELEARGQAAGLGRFWVS